ncbi:hypothetical protein DDI_3712 [Dickeya dianthicola RNS04.9]|nr:hypothetical protein DDI_3712 [Dickeya dianthicola RNS04.9]
MQLTTLIIVILILLIVRICTNKTLFCYLSIFTGYENMREN